MVVDDDADILDVVQRSLRKWDLVSDGFTSPARALEHFRLNSDLYSLVISDLKMREMSGFDFIEQITQIKPDIKVTMMTAFIRDTVDIPEMLRGILKVDSILEKPVGIRKVCLHVRKQLQIG
jgi:DNA-binding NtrC family response regulator